MKHLDIPICDSHLHVFWGGDVNKKTELIREYIRRNNYGFVAVQAIPHGTLPSAPPHGPLENAKCIYYKTQLPDKVFAFAGFHHNPNPCDNTKEYYLEMAKFYMAAGYDGFKMIEDPLKNPLRKPYTNYDCEEYDLFFDYCEKEQIPVTIHTSGPEFSWDEGHTYHNAPLSFLDCYDVFRRLLSKHPNLRLSLAHFFFISGHIDVAAEFLDKYPNIYYDLTPNPFMYDDFAKNPKMWREFFIKYQDRILFGTDSGDNHDDIEFVHSDKLVYLVRTFLEGTEPFRIFDCDVAPINLDKSVLKKIYYDNIVKYLGRKTPVKAVTEYAKKELEGLLKSGYNFTQEDLEDIEIMKKVF